MSTWEPFGEPARQAIVEAQTSARGLGADVVDAEHIVVGIAHAGGPAAQALESSGASVELIDETANRLLPHGSQGLHRELLFTPRAKRVIEGAFREARRLKHNYISTEHLLLGYLGEFGSDSDLLKALGLDANALRTTLERGA